jgi:predicted permease
MAVRAALGASRARLVRQVLTESVLLALLGGALGLFLAYLGLDLLVAFAARLTPRADEIRLDAGVLLFALVVSFATSFLFGLLASLPLSGDLGVALKEGGTSVTPGRNRTRNALIVSQVALSFTLLIGAGLMTRSLIKLSNVNPGFNPENVLSMSISLNWTKYSQPKQISDFFQHLLERVRALSGVRSAAVSMTFPLDTMGPMRNDLRIEGYNIPPGEPGPAGDFRDASSDYFETIGMPLLRGRTFTDSDNADAPPVVIINQSLARHYWNQQDPLAHRVSFDNGKTWRTIVGVVGDVKQYGLANPAPEEIYVPFPQSPLLGASLLVRTAANPISMARDVIAVVHQIDPQQPVAHVQTLKQVRDDSLASPRLTAILLSLFAVLALVITAAGISGIVALAVSQRTHEIGIRMVLGATPANVLGMVLRQGMAPVLIGLGLGVAGALALTGLMSSLLFGVEPADPFTFIASLLAAAAIAAVACLWPARRATSIQPIVALRAE